MKKVLVPLHATIVFLVCLILTSTVTSTKANAETFGDLTYEISNGEVSITDCRTRESSIVIPKTIDGYPVTRIGERVFFWCTSLTNISIPDSVKVIENNAFDNCTSLTSISIPDSVTSIGKNAFSTCIRLEQVYVSRNVREIEPGTFYNCTSLSSVSLPSGVTTIGEGAFSGCSKLERVTLPDSVTTIGKFAFEKCSSLSSFNIPVGVSVIGEGVFRDCSLLAEVDARENIKEIGARAYENCTSLTSVSLSHKLLKVGEGAFSGCPRDLNLYYCGTMDQWNNVKIASPDDTLKQVQFHYHQMSSKVLIPATEYEDGVRELSCLLCSYKATIAERYQPPKPPADDTKEQQHKNVYPIPIFLFVAAIFGVSLSILFHSLKKGYFSIIFASSKEEHYKNDFFNK